MGRISRSNALVGNVFIWEDRKSVTGGSWDISLVNGTDNTKTAKLIGLKGHSTDPLVSVYYYEDATVGGTTRTPFNTNMSDNAAANTVTIKAGLGSLTGGSLIPMVDKVDSDYELDSALSMKPELCVEIPAGKTFSMRLVPATGGTLFAGLTWIEH